LLDSLEVSRVRSEKTDVYVLASFYELVVWNKLEKQQRYTKRNKR